MHFYHEGYYDAYCTGAELEDLASRDRRDREPTYEPIRTPAMLHWLAAVTVALCIIAAAIYALS